MEQKIDIRFMNGLNPFLKAVSVLIAGLMLAFSYLVSLNLAVCGLCLALLCFFSRAKLSTMAKILIPAMIAAVSLFMTGLLHSSGSGGSVAGSENFQVAMNSSLSVYNAMQLSTRVLAFAMLGILFSLTTDGELFIQSLMHQCGLKPKFAYGILAAFHLMPHIGEEYRNARMAFETRGIKVGIFSMKPLFAAMVNCLRWSESIAMAMESKGFDGDGKRTYYYVTRIHWYDVAFLAVLNLAVGAGLFLLSY